jgi:hypothetical protein
MKLLPLLCTLITVPALADSVSTPSPVPSSAPVHRYLIERTFPPGALDTLDAAGKAKINATNARYGVHWLKSYANAGKTKTYCIYEAPSESAVRESAKANHIPIDSVTEVPVTLLPR